MSEREKGGQFSATHKTVLVIVVVPVVVAVVDVVVVDVDGVISWMIQMLVGQALNEVTLFDRDINSKEQICLNAWNSKLEFRMGKNSKRSASSDVTCC